MTRKIKVAIIGAGAAGLCAVKHLKQEANTFEFVVYEQQDDIGGTWRYTSKIGRDDFGLPIHSSMYENLRTNLPKEIMAFPGFQFSGCEERSFIHHSDVLQYLKDYAKEYDLMPFIKFHSEVKNVQPMDVTSRDPKWLLEVRNVLTEEETSEIFDAVMVCNGHYSVPFIPMIPGLNAYEGLLLHSHDYRNNKKFENLNVVVLGAGASGIDIALEIAAVAKEVVLSHNLPSRTCPLPKNLIQEAGITGFDKGTVTFSNGNSFVPDAVVLCTGYLYTYDFLHHSCHMVIGDQRVQPLYKHLFHINFPTLAIWAVPKQILPFPIYDQQVKVFLRYLKAEVDLPSQSDMLMDEESDFQMRLARGMKARHAHTMPGVLQWDYDDQISTLGKIDPLPESTRNLFKHVHTIRKVDVLNYKTFNFKVLDNEKFIEI